MTFSIFRNEGNWPVEKDIKNIRNCREMSFFRSFKNFMGMLFGPDDLWESWEDIIRYISFLSMEVKKNVFVFVLDRPPM